MCFSEIDLNFGYRCLFWTLACMSNNYSEFSILNRLKLETACLFLLDTHFTFREVFQVHKGN